MTHATPRTDPDLETSTDPDLDTATADDELTPRGSFGLLRDPTFGPFFAGKLLSTIGVWIHNIAAAIVVWDLTRSTLLVGAVSIGQFTPQLLLAPWSGARADRGDRRRQLLAGRMVTAAGSGGLALWIWLIGIDGTSGAAVVIAAATVVGIGFALGGPAMNALIPALVRPRELPGAIALGSLPMTVARSAGPAIGALLLYSAGPAAAFAAAALLSMVFTVIIAVISIRDVPRRQSNDGSVRAGWRYLRADAGMSALMLGVVAIGIGADPVITLTPAIADRLGQASSFVGTLASSFGIGAAVGFLMLSRVRLVLGLPRLAVTGLIGLAIGMLALAITPNVIGAITAMAIGGIGMAFALTSLTTMIQQQVPEDLRGRVMALWGVAFLGSRPIAAGVSGAITDNSSVVVALVVVSVILLLGAITVRPSRVNPYRVRATRARRSA
ncbi:MAG: MFS transporter [Intrasporangiaceae bacterium]|nr:MFS transporter [Intrasporangiaceae bacterium]